MAYKMLISKGLEHSKPIHKTESFVTIYYKNKALKAILQKKIKNEMFHYCIFFVNTVQ